ncbi:MAG: tryptophan-rich sensory protein [Candidatus Pacebacteria bacterium]|nr:tryptophan-rich sensory protein [Candidatus Paceibacterota bacterium]
MKQNLFIKIGALVSFIGVIIVNSLANSLPINGINTGAVSNLYPNLFVPAAFTFSIWGLIYFLLSLYTLYQIGFFQKKKEPVNEVLIKRVGIYFIITSIANMAWIFFWHYSLLWLSLIAMFVILFGLIKIANIIKEEKLSRKEKFFISLPFNVYFGWITVATIANITAFLVSINWNGFGISEIVWTIIVLFVGTLICIFRMFKERDIVYGLVFLWAYFGILIKHLSIDGFYGQYPDIIMAVTFCMLAFLGSLFLLRKAKF